MKKTIETLNKQLEQTELLIWNLEKKLIDSSSNKQIEDLYIKMENIEKEIKNLEQVD
jgi:hypothetical protein